MGRISRGYEFSRVGAAAGRPEVFTCTILLHLVTVTWRLHNDLSCIPVCESEFLTQECSPKSLTLNVKTSGGAMIFSVCATCRCNHSSPYPPLVRGPSPCERCYRAVCGFEFCIFLGAFGAFDTVTESVRFYCSSTLYAAPTHPASSQYFLPEREELR